MVEESSDLQKAVVNSLDFLLPPDQDPLHQDGMEMKRKIAHNYLMTFSGCYQ